MENKIQFHTIGNHARAGTKRGSCVASVVHNDVWSKEDIAREVARYSGLLPVQAMAFMDALGEAACAGIAAGNKLNFGPFSIGISMKGVLKDANSKFDPAKNGLGLFFKPARELTAALANLEPENATPLDRPWLDEVGCQGVAEANCIRIGSRVVMNGKNLRVDAGRADEGAWLEGASGERLAKGEVVDTTSARLVCVFREPLACGTYRLSVCTRDGGAENGATSAVSRRVRVVG